MSKQFWAVIIVIVLGFVGLIVINGNKNTTATNTTSSQATNHVVGLGKSGVTLVEYADYECPYCEQYFAVTKQIQQEYNDQLTFQFRNFPLVSVHVNAFSAARAAEAAGLQNKFWEMHDALYAANNWGVWTVASDPTPIYELYASQIGLNIAQFKTDFASSKVNDLINADMAAGTKLGVAGTPTYYLDGKQVSIAPNVAAFEKVINAELAAKTASTK